MVAHYFLSYIIVKHLAFPLCLLVRVDLVHRGRPTPRTKIIFLADGEARDSQVVGDFIDDLCTEGRVRDEG